MVKFGWDKLKRFLAQANTWTGQQTFSNIAVTGGSIAGATITENFTTSSDPATNAAVTTTIVNTYNGVVVTLTAAGNTQTLQNPTTTATIRKFMVINNDTSNNSLSVVANSVTFVLTAGEGQCFLWDGSAWGPTDLGITEIPVIVSQGGTGRSTGTTAYSLVATGTTATGAQQTLANGATTEVLVGGGASALPAWGTDIPTAVTIGSAYIYRAGGTDVPIEDGGTGAATAQAAINTLTAVASATNEHVLTKDTTTGNAIFKAIGSPTTWSSVSSANYTAAPASTSTITMTADLTGSILVGQSLKYTIGGVVYYGRVAIIAANLLTINGAPLSGNVSDLYFGGGTIRQAQIVIPGAYEDATNTALIASDLKSSLIWSLPKSYCVAFAVYSNTHDTGTHGQASVRINGTELCTTAGGLTIAADATWYASVVDIDVAAYDVNPGEAIEVTSVKAGNGDASDLTVKMIIVTP